MEHENKKRKTDFGYVPDEGDLNENDIEKIVDEAPEIEPLDEAEVKKMILHLERKINHNQMQRMKFAEDPEKFMESEVDLDESIKKLTLLATAPEFYPLLVKLNAVTSLLGLLSHENVDIAIDIIDLLHELTEEDTLQENEEAMVLVDALLENQVIELLFQNLGRLNPDVTEENQAIHNTLGVFENLIDAKGFGMCEELTKKVDLLNYLLNRIQSPKMDDTKLYSSEMLAILVQNSTSNQVALAEKNGIDILLLALAVYKKKDPPIAEEEELVENLFDALCASLQLLENQRIFLKSQGIELMLIMIKSKTFTRKCALKALDYALLNNTANCTHFVEALGLKTLFAALMKKPKKNKKGFDEDADEEHITAIIISLFKHLSGTHLDRLVNKFIENKYEKIERFVEIHEKYAERVYAAEQLIDAERKEMLAEGETIDEEEEERFYLQKLDSGLFTLQQADLVLAYAATASPPTSLLEDKEAKDTGIKEKIEELLDIRNKSIKEIKEVLYDYAKNIGKGGEQERETIKNLADAL